MDNSVRSDDQQLEIHSSSRNIEQSDDMHASALSQSAPGGEPLPPTQLHGEHESDEEMRKAWQRIRDGYRKYAIDVNEEKLENSSLIKAMRLDVKRIGGDFANLQQKYDILRGDHESLQVKYRQLEFSSNVRLEQMRAEMEKRDAESKERDAESNERIDELIKAVTENANRADRRCTLALESVIKITRRSRAEHETVEGLLYKHERLFQAAGVVQPLQADGTAPVDPSNNNIDPNLDQQKMSTPVERLENPSQPGWGRSQPNQ